MKTSIDLIDNSFDKNNLSNYILSIQVHEYSVTVCVFDIHKQIAVAIWRKNTKYSLLSEKQSVHTLNSLLDQCSIPLQESYKSCSVAVATGHFSFIPKAIFDDTQVKNYVELNCGPLSEIDYKSELVEHENLVIAYAIQKLIIDAFEIKLKNFKLFHHKKILINSITSDFKAEETELFANYNNKRLELLYFKKGKFHFGNSYEIKSAADFIYFVLNTVGQLGLNPQKLKLILIGEITTGDEIHHLAFSYFEKIQFGVIQSNLKLASILDELPKHYFYSILKQHQCE